MNRETFVEVADLLRLKDLILAKEGKGPKPYNPQLNQVKDRIERIRWQGRDKKGDAKKRDTDELHKLQVDKDRLERITERK